MSETCGVIALGQCGDKNLSPGRVGRPFTGVDLKIEEDGEILVKGDTLMIGYLEEEDAKGSYSTDGYFRTGDLGYLDSLGYLHITGRKKNLIILSTGKKVPPEPVENRLCSIAPIEGAVLLKSGERFVAAAVFVPAPDLMALKAEVGEKGVEAALMAKIHQALKDMSDYEIPKKLFIIEGTAADFPGMLTPTLKIRRNVFFEKFAPQIEAIYQS